MTNFLLGACDRAEPATLLGFGAYRLFLRISLASVATRGDVIALSDIATTSHVLVLSHYTAKAALR